jgi:hypothetical protein
MKPNMTALPTSNQLNVLIGLIIFLLTYKKEKSEVGTDRF